MARMYFDKFGQETAMVRIGSCFEKPGNHRMMATWFSPADFQCLIEWAFAVRRLGCHIVWGVSANDECWWDNAEVAYQGWRPQDNSEIFRPEIEAMPRPAAAGPTPLWQGGAFTADPLHTEDKT